MTGQIADGGFGLSDQIAYAIYGIYTAFVYLVALPGGWIADRLWGRAARSSWAASSSCAGTSCSRCIARLRSSAGLLLLVVLGTGLLKPNVSAVVGELYAQNDPRRDAGFTIFYMGINIGGLLGPLVCGYLGHDRLALRIRRGRCRDARGARAVSTRSSGFLGAAGQAPVAGVEHGVPQSVLVRRPWQSSRPLSRCCGPASPVSSQFDAVWLARGTTAALAVGALAYFRVSCSSAGGLTPIERRRVLVILVLVMASAVFWAGYEQFGSSLNSVRRALHGSRLRRRSRFRRAGSQSLNSLFLDPAGAVLLDVLDLAGAAPARAVGAGEVSASA